MDKKENNSETSTLIVIENEYISDAILNCFNKTPPSSRFDFLGIPKNQTLIDEKTDPEGYQKYIRVIKAVESLMGFNYYQLLKMPIPKVVHMEQFWWYEHSKNVFELALKQFEMFYIYINDPSIFHPSESLVFQNRLYLFNSLINSCVNQLLNANYIEAQQVMDLDGFLDRPRLSIKDLQNMSSGSNDSTT